MVGVWKLRIGPVSREKAILERLDEHGLLELAELTVHYRAGTAFVEGTVSNLRQMWLIGEVVRQIPGVAEVVNKLRVVPLLVLDDKDLKEQVKATVSRNDKINKPDISIEVNNGVVYLIGIVNTAVEKHLVEHEIGAIPGVRGIVNEIQAVSGSTRSKAHIISEILDGFSKFLGLDLTNIDVDYREGTVYLRGTVPDQYLKQAAAELAGWTLSVTRVVNELGLPGPRTPVIRK